MKITVITGSPHKKGTSFVLADEFIKGASEKGHEIFRFDSAFENIKPCDGCDACLSSGKCIIKDDMKKIYDNILDSDVIAFITPLYYFGMSAQMKTVIDRFYSINYKIMGSGKKSILMATSYDNNDWTMEALVNHYETIVKYLKLEDKGIILATSCGVRDDIINSSYPKEAYEMGKNL